jgi:4-amino-4-deoxy-L-arabinose transferase-like glycosyltransferase
MARWPLMLLLLLYAILALRLAAVTPYRQAGVLLHQRSQGASLAVPDVGAPDERQHANYIAHLREGKGFPVLVPGSPDLGETYQSHQPPLYYLLAAGWSRLVGADPTDPEAGFRLRLLNILVGAGTVVGVFMACLWGLGPGRGEAVGLAASAVAALMPMVLALNAAVGNDPLLYLLCTWTVAICLGAVRTGWTAKGPVLAGVLAGLAMLTKTSALALLPTIALALWLSPAPERGAGMHPKVRALLLAFVPFLVLAAPWWMRNNALYGDPLAMRAFNAAFVGSPQAAAFVAAFGPWGYWVEMVGWWTLRSFFGAFGYMDIFLPVPVYAVATGIALVLAGAWIWQWARGPKEERAFHRVVLAFLVVVGLLFVQFNMTYFQGQARYLYPAIASIAIVFGVGAVRLVGRWAWAVLAGLLLALDLYVAAILPGEFERRMGPSGVAATADVTLGLAPRRANLGALRLDARRPIGFEGVRLATVVSPPFGERTMDIVVKGLAIDFLGAHEIGAGLRFEEGAGRDKKGLEEELLRSDRGLNHGLDLRLEIMGLVDHVRDAAGVDAVYLFGEGDLGEDPEDGIGVDAADREVVVGVLAVVEVESAEHALVEEEGHDVLDIGPGQMVAGVDQHLRPGARLLGESVRHSPVGDVGMVEGRLEGLVFDEHRHLGRHRIVPTA